MHCLNCQKEISSEFDNCPYCGQKTKEPKLSLLDIISDFFSNVFNFDAKIYQTLLHLFVPGKLTKSYVQGARTKYYPPLRILFFSMVVYFGLLASSLNRVLPDLDKFSTENHKVAVENEVFQKIDSLSRIYLSHEQLPKMDSIKAKVLNRKTTASDTIFMHGANVFDIYFTEENILSKDAFELSGKELLEKYDIKEKHKRLIIPIVQKVYTKPGGVPSFLIGNMLWTIILAIFLLAVFMKIIFIRKPYQYVEHIVFLMHVHAATFVFFAVLMFICQLINYQIFEWNDDGGSNLNSSNYLNLSFFPAIIFFFIALKKYYEQGIIKTSLKFFAISFCYMIIVFFMTLIVAALSLYFF